jgi:hypothetical protein
MKQRSLESNRERWKELLGLLTMNNREESETIELRNMELRIPNEL